MKRYRFIIFSAFVTVVAIGATFPVAGQAPTGKLILAGDLALFAGPGKPENCFLRNRYKKGDPVGFRMTAIDGATGETETTADLVVHVTYGGKTVDVPTRYRGVIPPGGRGTAIPFLWTAKWIVPDDAPIGVVRYTVTAQDKKGRMAEWKPFPNQEAAQLTIIE
jgi:hypothetical protein